MEPPKAQPENKKLQKIAIALRGVARVWSILVWLLALILILGSRNAPTSLTLDNGPLDWLIPLMLVISLAGLAVAFRREGWGVLINFAFYLAIVPIYGLLHGEWMHFSIMIGLSPVILPGVMFGAAWILSRQSTPKIRGLSLL